MAVYPTISVNKITANCRLTGMNRVVPQVKAGFPNLLTLEGHQNKKNPAMISIPILIFKGKQIQTFSLLIFLLLINKNIHSQEMYNMPSGSHSRLSSFENLNGIHGKGNPAESIKAGETKVLLNIGEAGMINRMWFTINNRSPSMLRSLRFRMYW